MVRSLDLGKVVSNKTNNKMNKWKGWQSAWLTNRYISTECPECGQPYTVDQGSSEDYFDYILKLKYKKSQCPTCEHVVECEAFTFNFVEN